MSKAVLEIVGNVMKALGIPYGYRRFVADPDKPMQYPYFVGEYTESEPMTEDGLQESVFLLTGFSRSSFEDLEDAKERIREQFHPVTGRVGITKEWSSVAIFYAGAQPVETGDSELYRIQINLNIKEWMVN